jgi:hypothetical protein
MNSVDDGNVVRRGMHWAHGIFSTSTILRPFQKVSRLKEHIHTRVLKCLWVFTVGPLCPQVLFRLEENTK